jgi:cytochrome c553
MNRRIHALIDRRSAHSPARSGWMSVRYRTFAVGALAAIAASALVADPASDLRSQASAAAPDAGHGQILYLKHCAACHRSHAWGDGPREIPALAGQRQRYLIEQLALFASGQRQASLIHGPAMHDTLQRPDLDRPQAIADLAAYLAPAPPNPQPEHSEGRAPAAGRSIYLRACSACHDSAGGGRADVPAIGGQHYRYLLAQLRAFAAGRREHPSFTGFGGVLSGEQQEAVADYVSRLRP